MQERSFDRMIVHLSNLKLSAQLTSGAISEGKGVKALASGVLQAIAAFEEAAMTLDNGPEVAVLFMEEMKKVHEDMRCVFPAPKGSFMVSVRGEC